MAANFEAGRGAGSIPAAGQFRSAKFVYMSEPAPFRAGRKPGRKMDPMRHRVAKAQMRRHEGGWRVEATLVDGRIFQFAYSYRNQESPRRGHLMRWKGDTASDKNPKTIGQREIELGWWKEI